jgi:RsiW-degrading membrane proteinase PrsW (M82 family)
MGFAACAALAVGPGLVLVHLVWSRDRRREPLGNLGAYLALGALSVLPAALVERLLHRPVLGAAEAGASLAATAAWAFLAVALVEEGCKLGALRLRAGSDRRIDEPIDWLVYAVAVSLGFASLENALYVTDGGLAVGLVRAFTAVPAHALDGTMMGWRLARAQSAGARGAARERWLAWIEPAAWHGAYDFLLLGASAESGTRSTALLVAWSALVLAQWAVCVRRVRRLCAEQSVPAPPLLAPVELARRLRGRPGP